METQEFLIDEAGKRNIIKHLHRQVVCLLVVLVEAWVRVKVHSVRKLKKEVSWRHSWLPRSMMTCLGLVSFMARIRRRTSMEKLPRST